MSTALTVPGEYRGEVIDFALIEKKNDKGDFGGLSLAIKVRAREVWMCPEGSNTPDWLNCEDWEAHGEGYIVLVSKVGKVNEQQIARLVKYAGWDGNFENLADKSWQPSVIRFSIEEDRYEGNVTYRINWINQFDSNPGGGGNVDVERAKVLNSQFGPSIRAIVSNARGPKPAPTAGKPTPPTAPAATRQLRKSKQNEPAVPQPLLSTVPDSEIPF